MINIWDNRITYVVEIWQTYFSYNPLGKQFSTVPDYFFVLNVFALNKREVDMITRGECRQRRYIIIKSVNRLRDNRRGTMTV